MLRSGREGDDDFLIAFVHQGEPASKARARFSFKTGHAYTPQRTLSAEAALSEAFRRVTNGQTRTGNIAIAMVFFRPNHQRIDADNLSKLVLDAATKARVWEDDCQVTAQLALVEYDPVNPRTEIAIGPSYSTLQRGAFEAKCPRCGTTFRKASFAQKRKYCSAKCAQPTTTARCARCEKEFRRRSAAQRFCSKTCARTGSRPRHANPLPACLGCGVKVSRREYRMCSRCAPKGRRRGSKNKPKPVPVSDDERPGVHVRVCALAL